MSEEIVIPKAIVSAKQKWSWYLVVPVLAIIAAVGLMSIASGQRGITISVTFKQGHGIKAGDTLKYRGIEVGEVERVILNEALKSLTTVVRLTPEAEELARPPQRLENFPSVQRHQHRNPVSHEHLSA